MMAIKNWFVKIKNKTYFKDSTGKLWSGDDLRDLFEYIKERKDTETAEIERRMWLEKETEDAIERNKCKKCNKVIVLSLMTGFMSGGRKGSCKCKPSESKIYTKKQLKRIFENLRKRAS